MEKQSPLPMKVGRDEIKDMGDVLIEVKELLNELQESVGMEELLSQTTERSIYEIPQFMREFHPKAFEPQLVSFGPYHQGKHHLLPMELEKHKAFLRFKAKNNLDFESIVESVSSILADLWGSYDKLDDRWKQDPAMFLKMMIVDGCFMLDFISECPESLRSMVRDIKRDMLLLENQLPMQLLKQLHTIRANEQKHLDLEAMIWYWMRLTGTFSMENHLHILDMYRTSLLSPEITKEEVIEKMVTIQELNLIDIDTECQSIPSATELRKSGIKFEKSSTRSLMDVSFDYKRRVLRVPSLVVDDIMTEPSLLNAMAFEKLHVGLGSQVTSFVIFMKNLIEVEKDVSLLASKGILSNVIHDRNGVVKLFSLLAKGQTKNMESYMHDVIKVLNWYCKNSWSIWWENLKVPETQNPWAVISIAAAFFGFVPPIIQSISNGHHRRHH